MTLSPNIVEKLARARADMRMGVPVVLSEGLVITAVEAMSPARFSDFLKFDTAPVLAITNWRAKTLKARAYDTDIARIALPSFATLTWVQSIADPANDLNHPMKGPLQTIRDGAAGPFRAGIALAKSARLLPAILGVEIQDPVAFAAEHNLTLLSGSTITNADLSPMAQVIHARVPLQISEKARLHVFRPEDGAEEHYAIEIGHPDRASAVLARLHSACFTGDILGSLKCDCGAQLNAALSAMGAESTGVLLYLNQEGRGIGLANKMRAYSLQDQGFDTVEANHRLGFEDDERDFRIGSEILRRLGFSQVRLLTNNPAKVAMMEASGIKVAERVPLKVGLNPLNAKYLDTKAKKSGHIL